MLIGSRPDHSGSGVGVGGWAVGVGSPGRVVAVGSTGSAVGPVVGVSPGTTGTVATGVTNDSRTTGVTKTLPAACCASQTIGTTTDPTHASVTSGTAIRIVQATNRTPRAWSRNEPASGWL